METIIKETDATKDYNIMDNSNLYTKNNYNGSICVDKCYKMLVKMLVKMSHLMITLNVKL